ncbi:hypothetical protein F4803DRAFT_499504 [Xylaria telfairii]|nr:hypothetical protein F4803DRAFT_499504 [Xylaria telfairii]
MLTHTAASAYFLLPLLIPHPIYLEIRLWSDYRNTPKLSHSPCASPAEQCLNIRGDILRSKSWSIHYRSYPHANKNSSLFLAHV